MSSPTTSKRQAMAAASDDRRPRPRVAHSDTHHEEQKGRQDDLMKS
jgi:hypothetical protein